MKIIQMIGMAAAALTVAACSSDDIGMDAGNERVAVQFIANVGSVTSRAVDQTWSANDKIGIFMKKTGMALNAANISEGASNISYTYRAETYFNPTTTTTIYYPMNGDEVDFVAYYPFDASEAKIDASGATYDIDVADQTNQEAIDFMYSNNVTGKSKADKQAALSFTHQLCKVVLIVQAGEGMTETEMEGLTVRVREHNTKAKFDLANGTLGATGIPATSTLYKQADAYVYEAILLPTTELSRIFEFTLKSGETFTWNMNKALEGGNKYTYSISIGA